MKKILLAALFVPALALAQTFPSPTFSSITLQTPLSPANGGTGTSLSTGNGPLVLSNSPTITSPTFTGTVAFSLPPVIPAQCHNIMSYGGNNTNLGSNNTAFAAAAVAGPSGQACVYFPAGTYNFATAPSYTVPTTPGSITIEGDGAESTVLSFSSSNGVTIGLNSPYQTFHVRDVTFAGGTGSTYNALTVNQSSPEGAFFQSDITNVSFRSITPGNPGWANAVLNNGASAVSFVSDYFLGDVTSISLQASANSPYYAQDFNITNCTFFGGTNAILFGSYIQAVQVSNSYFVNLVSAVTTPNGAAGALEGLQFTGNSVGVSGYGIDLNTAISQVDIANNLFTSSVENSNTLISMDGASGFTIVGNTFSSTGTMSGIFVENSVSGTVGTITGNSFQSLATAVGLAATANGVNVQSNAYIGNTANVTNLGTSACPASGSGNCVDGGAVGSTQSNGTTGTPLTTNTTVNATSIPLSAGVWAIQANCKFTPAGTTQTSGIFCGVSQTSATLPVDANMADITWSQQVIGSARLPSPVVYITLTSAATVYAVAQGVFLDGTMTADGSITALRIH